VVHICFVFEYCDWRKYWRAFRRRLLLKVEHMSEISKPNNPLDQASKSGSVMVSSTSCARVEPGLAIVSRLLAREFGSIDRAATRRRASLPAWRVKRAIDYIDAHLSEQLSLSDIAQSAGLSRMHFAAQFRAATGMRPHEFLLRRRVERAQTLLMRPRLTSLDVALSTGFRSQAHFTTVFKRLVGETPARWRADARGNS